MITENLSTLKIHKLTQSQYNRELAAGRIDENALYLTPDDGSSGTTSVSSATRCSDIGMTPNDTNGDNFQRLCEAMSTADQILVDGMYKLSASAAHLITKNVNLIGETHESGFNVDGVLSSMFTVGDTCSKIELRNIKVVNTSGRTVQMFVKSNYKTGRMSHVVFEGNTFIGRTSPMRFTQANDVNPDEVNIGVDYIGILNNKFEGTTCHGFVFQNVSYNTVEVKGNTIHNFDNVFLDVSVNNDSLYNQVIARSKKNLIITNNNVFCDDTCFHDETSTSSYYGFVIAEGLNVTYMNNKVEGLKSRVDVALYDAYLSCENVIYEQNLWKNNYVLCAVDGETNNNLMKAKSSSTGYEGKRKYHNNVFILEKSFAEKHGADDGSYVQMISNVADNLWDVRENYIDVWHLVGFTSSSHITSLAFKNNIVKTEKWVTGSLLAGVADAEIFCEGNSIICDDGTAFSGSTSGSYMMKRFVARNNTFQNCRYALGSALAKELIVCDNTIIDDQENNGMLGTGKYEKVTGAGNKIVKTNGFYSMFAGNYSDSIDLSVDATLDGTTTDRRILTIPKGARTKVSLEFECTNVKTLAKSKGYFVVNIDEDKAEYKSSAAGVISVLASGSGVTAFPVAHVSEGTFPFSLRVQAVSDDTGFAFSLDKTSGEKYTVTTRMTSSPVEEIKDPVIIPAGYTRVYALETSGTQYFKTGVNASQHPNGISYEMTAEFLDASLSYLWGGGTNPRSGNITYGSSSKKSDIAIACGGNNETLCSITNIPLNEKLVFAVTDLTATNPTGFKAFLNGSECYKGNVTAVATDMPDAEIYLLHCSGSSRTNPYLRLHGFTMKDSTGAYIRNFVPVVRNSDNVAGLYDDVTKTFFTNAGTGTFIVHADPPVVEEERPLTTEDMDTIVAEVYAKILAESNGNGVAY